MRHHWSLFAKRVLLTLLLTLLAGWLIGYPREALLLFLISYLAWTLIQSFRLHHWLYRGLLTDPPESNGLWGELFDGIYRLQMKNARSRDRLQAMINRVQESTNSLKDAVIMTDSTGAMEWWNQAAEDMLGFRFPNDRGVVIQNLIRTPEFKHYFTAKQYRNPLHLLSPNNKNVHLQLQITLFGEEDRLIVVQDVTRLIKLEEMRRDFVSNVSHELRTPLTVISGYLETLIDNVDQVEPKWKKALLQMQSQSNRMEALINDLLLLSRIENQGRSQRRNPIDVCSLLEGLLEDAKALIGQQSTRVTLSIETDKALNGDETQILSAFSNLVYNAVKYTPEGGDIALRWFADTTGLHFSVSDTGIGIDPVHIPRLTERFYRADPSRHSSSGGTGLGLAIVKHVLINHDARLEIQSRPGVGSTFICHFPKERIGDTANDGIN
ncbi:MAG: phosphate regulon sensor histidine kinase PhoR [Hahellaceae bacterium]|nr:phosphate regulon sensor histidine kinase PhoR [Hahellaceae bacterium]